MLPPAAVSLDEAHAAIELWEFYKRRTLDDTQRLTVEVMMATQADGLWAAPTTGREMPRQGGKGDEIEVVELWGLTQRSERILHTVHDAVLLATETQSRLLSVIEGHADLRRLKLRAWRGTGQQMIEMRNGGIIWYRTRTGGGARGVDEVDRIIVDEAQHAEDEHLAAITPTQLASANPQLNALGTGGITGKSRWWWSVRKRALRHDPGDFGYVGHTAERLHLDGSGRVVRDPVDVSTIEAFEALLPLANPVYRRRPELRAFFLEQYERLGPEMAAREHLGIWDPEPGELGLSSIPEWATLADRASRIASDHCWAVAMSPVEHGNQWVSIGVAGRTDAGRLHVEWMDHRPLKAEWFGEVPGVPGLVLHLAEIQTAKPIPLRIHAQGPEGALIAPLRKAGVEVVEVSSADVERATGQVIAAASSGDLVHLGQPSLDKAVAGAVLRTGSSGAASWSQRSSSVEITPLVAVTVAAGGVSQPSIKTTGLFLAVT